MNKKTPRHPSTKTALAILAAFSILAASVAFADGDTRRATQAEKDYTRLVQNAFTKALPPGPAGWDQTTDTTAIKDLELVTAGAEEYPLQVEYCAAWQDTKKLQEAREQLDAELIKLAKGPPANITDKAIADLEKRCAARDAKVRIDLKANALNPGIYEKIAPAASIAGGLVYRSQSEFTSNSGWREGSTYVFLGKGWKVENSSSTSTYMKFSANKSLPHTAVQCIMVRINADPARAQGIVDKIDWEALKKLIKS